MTDYTLCALGGVIEQELCMEQKICMGIYNFLLILVHFYIPYIKIIDMYLNFLYILTIQVAKYTHQEPQMLIQ